MVNNIDGDTFKFHMHGLCIHCSVVSFLMITTSQQVLTFDLSDPQSNERSHQITHSNIQNTTTHFPQTKGILITI